MGNEECRESGYLVDALEALGLLKFKEEKKIITTMFNVPIEAIIEGLRSHGYVVYPPPKMD